MTFSLTVEARTERGKGLTALREAGKLPAIMYGPKEESTAISIDRVEFEKLFKKAGESSVITLEGLDKPKDVLVHDVAFNSLRGGMIHVDFYAIESGKEVTVHVPLEFDGEAPAIKLGGTLTKVLFEVEVTCVPKNLPQSIAVDISVLEDFESRVFIKDLPVPSEVTVNNDPGDVVALVQVVEEEVEEPVEQVDMDAVEVEQKGKEDADGDNSVSSPEEDGKVDSE